jgi:hypothetical protein
MRFWIEYLSTNAQAFQDFENYFVGVEKSLVKALLKAVNKGEGKDRIYEIGVEMGAYDKIRQKLMVEMKEKQSQIGFDESRKE